MQNVSVDVAATMWQLMRQVQNVTVTKKKKCDSHKKMWQSQKNVAVGLVAAALAWRTHRSLCHDRPSTLRYL